MRRCLENRQGQGDNMGDLLPSGLTPEEIAEYRSRFPAYGMEMPGEVLTAEGTLKVLSAITAVVSVLSIMMQQVTFQYFIYEETGQLTEGIIKQLVRCRNYDEARVVLDWYRYEFAPEYINYHLNSKILAPISWDAFERDIWNMINFINEYERQLGV